MEEIKKVLMGAVKRELGEGYEVQIDTVTKNNGVTLHAIVIGKAGQNVHMNFYIDHITDKLYKGSINMLDAAREVIKVYKHNESKVMGVDIEMVGFTKQGILDRVVYQLVNAGKNSEQLANVPYRLFLDLAVIYRVIAGETESASSSFIVNHKVCEIYGICEAELNKAAKRNTAKRGFTVRPLVEVIESIAGVEGEYRDGCQLYILTSTDYLNGATVMLYPDYFSSLADKLGEDLYILPSSVHEVLAIPGAGVDSSALRSIVNDVNSNSVLEEEFLSGNVYKYSKENGEIELA